MGCGPSRFELDKEHHQLHNRRLRNNQDKKIEFECPAPIEKDEIERQEDKHIDSVTRNNDDDRNKEEDLKNGCQKENDKIQNGCQQDDTTDGKKSEEKENAEEKEEDDGRHDSDERRISFSPGSPSFRVYCDDIIKDKDSTHERNDDGTHENREEETLNETKGTHGHVPLPETEPNRRGRRRGFRNALQKGTPAGLKTILTAGNKPYKAIKFGLRH